jgi:MGT family glycosyltransferase
MRAARGLEPVRHVFDQVRRARRHLVLTSRAFEFPAVLPANVRYVGPVLDDPHWAMSATWAAPGGDAPLVLVAMSTTFQDQTDCLQHVVDALAALPVRGFVTTGPAIEPASLAGAPQVTIVPRAPHREVLRHAALVVTHAGHGTVMKALAAGVPLVMLPHGRDQDDTAARVTARHAGVAVKRTATADAIAQAIRRVLRHDSYRAAARSLGDAILRESTSDALIHELENIRVT